MKNEEGRRELGEGEMRCAYPAGEMVSANAQVLAYFVLISNLQVLHYGWKVEFTRWCIKRLNQNNEQGTYTPCLRAWPWFYREGW